MVDKPKVLGRVEAKTINSLASSLASMALMMSQLASSMGIKGKGPGPHAGSPKGRGRYSSPPLPLLSDWMPAERPAEGLKDEAGKALMMNHTKSGELVNLQWICQPVVGGCGQWHHSLARKFCANPHCNLKRAPRVTQPAVAPAPQAGPKGTPAAASVQPKAKAKAAAAPAAVPEDVTMSVDTDDGTAVEEEPTVPVAPVLAFPGQHHLKILAVHGIKQAVDYASSIGTSFAPALQPEEQRTASLARKTAMLAAAEEDGNPELIEICKAQILALQPKAQVVKTPVQLTAAHRQISNALSSHQVQMAQLENSFKTSKLSLTLALEEAQNKLLNLDKMRLLELARDHALALDIKALAVQVYAEAQGQDAESLPTPGLETLTVQTVQPGEEAYRLKNTVAISSQLESLLANGKYANAEMREILQQFAADLTAPLVQPSSTGPVDLASTVAQIAPALAPAHGGGEARVESHQDKQMPDLGLEEEDADSEDDANADTKDNPKCQAARTGGTATRVAKASLKSKGGSQAS
jgi:hypothetical protein